MDSYGNYNPHDCNEPAGPKDTKGTEPIGSAGEFAPGSMEASRNPNGTTGSIPLSEFTKAGD